MIYESDIDKLINQWVENPVFKSEPQYKDAVMDCIYDLRKLMDKNFIDEILAHEAFEEQLKEDSKFWNDYYNAFLKNDGIMAV